MGKLRCAALGVLAATLPMAGCSNHVITDDGQAADLPYWARSYHGHLLPTAVSSGGDGSVLLCGLIDGTANLGGGLLEADKLGSVFLAHLDPAGNHLLSGSTGAGAVISGAAIGPDGDLYLTGDFLGKLGFGSTLLEATQVGGMEGFLYAIDGGGKPAYGRAIKGKLELAVVDAMTVTRSGDVIIAAHADSVTDFGDGAVAPEPAVGQMVIAAYRRDGSPRWQVRMDDAWLRPLAIAADHDGNVVFASSTTHDSVTLADTTASLAAYVGKISPDGEPLWLRATSSAGDQELVPQVRNIGTDANGDIFVTGMYRAGFSIGGTALPAPQIAPEPDNGDGYLLKLDAAGQVLFARPITATSGQITAIAMAVSDSGQAVVATHLTGTLDAGAGIIGPQLGAGTVLARFRADGTVLRQQALPAMGDVRTWQVALDPNDKPVLTGTFDGDLDLSGTKLTAADPGELWAARIDF